MMRRPRRPPQPASYRSTPPRAYGGSSSRPSLMCRRRSPSMPTCRRATRPCAILPAFISASRCRFVPHMGRRRGGVAAVSELQGRSRAGAGLRHRPAPALGGARSSFDTAPKIIARLPFVDRADHPAAIPVFVVSRVAPDANGEGGRKPGACGSPAGARRRRRRSPPSPRSWRCPIAPSTGRRC